MSARPASGLQWRKLDLHVHTPASRDYTGPDVTAAQFVAKTLRKGIAGIAVTDHNSGAWIDPLVAAARGTALTVFPGVEISVPGGKHGIHMIALFGEDATTKTVENLLSKLGFSATDYGDLNAVATLGPEAVVDRIHEAGGLAVLAHADSSKGVLADMQGQQRTNVMNSPHLAAVEIVDVQKTARFCAGDDVNYKRKLAYYRASDNPAPSGAHGHSVEGVGARYTWMKSDGLSLEALRQVFLDPDQRIRCDQESPEMPGKMYPRIRGLEISSGFLSGMEFDFHEGLNSVIGGKGVGKSLVVEFLRFALNQASDVEAVSDDMLGKLEKQLGVGGTVTVTCQVDGERMVRIVRTYNGSSNPTRAIFVDSGKPVPGDIAQLFPVLAYSQTETIEIARDNAAQLKLIDSFLDLAPVESRLAMVEERLSKSDASIAEAETAQQKLDKAVKDLETHDEKIAAVDRALKSRQLGALNELKPKTQFMSALEEFAQSVERSVEGIADDVDACEIPSIPVSLTADKDVSKVVTRLRADLKALTASARTLEADAGLIVTRAGAAVAAWATTVKTKQKAYAEFVQRQGGDRPALLSRKTALEEQRPALAKAATSLRERIAALPSLRSQRAKLLAERELEIDKRHALREQKYQELTNASLGRLELELIKDGDRSAFASSLSTLKTGSRLQDSTIELICDSVDPSALVELVQKRDAATLAKTAHVSVGTATTLVNHLSSTGDVAGVLALEHGDLLRDKPRIRFKKEDGKYHELQELSIGQKCTALLIIALADGTRPIIIDQPEDALDITSVYEDVTLQLRARKSVRQFILTTHNPTVAVAGDSDQFHVLTASASHAQLGGLGAIDRLEVREAVIQHLEGGRAPFALKSKKYGLAVV